MRSYYRARSRMGSVLKSLSGAGVYGLSAEGRGRFDVLPDVVADDLWINRVFASEEVEIVDCPPWRSTCHVAHGTSSMCSAVTAGPRGKRSSVRWRGAAG